MQNGYNESRRYCSYFCRKYHASKGKIYYYSWGIEEKVKYLNVFINSEINTNIYRSPIQQALCIPIKQKDYSFFLKKDSFIDLNHPQEIEKTKVDWVVKNRPEAHKGRLTDDDLENCRKLIHSNQIISGKKCRQFGFFDAE